VKLIDKVAEWVHWALSVLPPATAAFLSIPVIVLVLAVGSTIFVRKLLHPLGRAVSVLLGRAAVLIGAIVLLPEVAVAAGYRQASSRPPAMVYSFGDAVASGVVAFDSAAQAGAAALGKVARINLLVVLLLVAAWLWLWNHGQCPDGAVEAGACVRPITAWWVSMGST